MATTQELAGTARGSERDAEAEAGAPPPPSPRGRARAYLDLWERHIALTSVDGPLRPGTSLRA